MASRERKSLVWTIKKNLLMLTADQLFQLAKNIGPVSGMDVSMFQVDDEESCFEYILASMNDDTLVEAEDSGMAVLLQLDNTVKDIIQSHVVSPKQNADKSASKVVNENADINTPDPTHTVRSNTTAINTDSSATQNTDIEIQRMLSSYAELSNKVLQTWSHIASSSYRYTNLVLTISGPCIHQQLVRTRAT